MKRAPRICTAGTVYCPLRRQDANLDTCLACEWLDEIATPPARDHDDAITLRCSPPATLRGWVR